LIVTVEIDDLVAKLQKDYRKSIETDSIERNDHQIERLNNQRIKR